MARCIGCGEALTGAACQRCQTPARGAKLAEKLTLYRWSVLPNVCACCMEPATTEFSLSKTRVYGSVTLAKIPACKPCASAGPRYRMVRLFVFVVLAIGLAVAGTRLFPAYAEICGAIAIVAGGVLAFPIAKLLWSSGAGHTPACLPARLAGQAGQGQVFVFGNRAFADLVRRANVGNEPPAEVKAAHAIEQMREGLGYPPQR
jgi:hypothetical protein